MQNELHKEQIEQIKKEADLEVQRMRTTCDTLEEQLVRVTQERDNARSEGRRLHERCEALEKREGDSAGLMSQGGKGGWWSAFREKGLFEEFTQAEFDFLREMLLVGAPRSAQNRRYQN